MVCVIFTLPALDRLGHEFEELLFHLGLGGGTEIGVLRAQGLKHA